MLAISHTAYPDGTIVKYPHGMEKPSIKCHAHIMKEASFKEAVKVHNTPKPGEAGFEDEAENFLNECKNYLTLTKR